MGEVIVERQCRHCHTSSVGYGSTVSSLSQSSSKGRSRSEEAFSCPCSCRYVVDLGVLFALEERSIVLLVSMRPRGVSQPQKGLQDDLSVVNNVSGAFTGLAAEEFPHPDSHHRLSFSLLHINSSFV